MREIRPRCLGAWCSDTVSKSLWLKWTELGQTGHGAAFTRSDVSATRHLPCTNLQSSTQFGISDNPAVLQWSSHACTKSERIKFYYCLTTAEHETWWVQGALGRTDSLQYIKVHFAEYKTAFLAHNDPICQNINYMMWGKIPVLVQMNYWRMSQIFQNAAMAGGCCYLLLEANYPKITIHIRWT